MVPEAPMERTEIGLVPGGDGWFVLNATEARWRERPQRGYSLPLEGAADFAQLGVTLFVLDPGEPIGMYHWEADQEDFLILSGEGLLLVEGQERRLRPWDFVHCPPETRHMIVGAGDGLCGWSRVRQVAQVGQRRLRRGIEAHDEHVVSGHHDPNGSGMTSVTWARC